jgi:hypothetical protein
MRRDPLAILCFALVGTGFYALLLLVFGAPRP